jgi:Arc/MetJ-type ribon-helix-helix transcriptional regulator
MRLSIRLPDDDVEFLDRYAATRGVPSRSAAVRRAVRLLRESELAAAYEDAWQEGSDVDVWDERAVDGVG